MTGIVAAFERSAIQEGNEIALIFRFADNRRPGASGQVRPQEFRFKIGRDEISKWR
jgi:hypothetical protein